MSRVPSRSAASWLGPFVLFGALASSGACADGVDSPTAPSLSSPMAAASTGLRTGQQPERVDLCHRTDNGFIPITVAKPSVDSHLAHGDAAPGQPVPEHPGATFGPGCTTSIARPVTITFADLLVNGAPFTSLVESGFTVAAAGPSSFTRAWEAWTLYGNPAPFLAFRVPPGTAETNAAILLTPESGSFQFVSVDLYSSVTPIPYQFIGYSAQPVSGGVAFTQVFTAAGTMPGTFGGFVTVENPYPEVRIDRLMIVLTNPSISACCGNAMGLDNIVLVR